MTSPQNSPSHAPFSSTTSSAISFTDWQILHSQMMELCVNKSTFLNGHLCNNQTPGGAASFGTSPATHSVQRRHCNNLIVNTIPLLKCRRIRIRVLHAIVHCRQIITCIALSTLIVSLGKDGIRPFTGAIIV